MHSKSHTIAGNRAGGRYKVGAINDRVYHDDNLDALGMVE
jgi:hypothetical protein